MSGWNEIRQRQTFPWVYTATNRRNVEASYLECRRRIKPATSRPGPPISRRDVMVNLPSTIRDFESFVAEKLQLVRLEREVH
jgi:hypothetical protein